MWSKSKSYEIRHKKQEAKGESGDKIPSLVGPYNELALGEGGGLNSPEGVFNLCTQPAAPGSILCIPQFLSGI